MVILGHRPKIWTRLSMILFHASNYTKPYGYLLVLWLGNQLGYKGTWEHKNLTAQTQARTLKYSL